MGNEQIIESVIRETTAQAISDVDMESFLSLQNAAKVFLNDIEMLSKTYESLISKSSLKSKITALYKEMRASSAETQRIISAQHRFEEELNRFLNRTIYLTYVKDDGTLLFYGDANIGKLYSQATANRGRGNISASKLFDANDLQESIKDDIEESMANKVAVYRTAIKRYKSNTDEAKMNYSPSAKTFYWYAVGTKIGWTSPIVNEGPIAEGYADAVINQDSAISNSNIESSLQLLWEKYIGKDSVGAALKGDVVYHKDGRIQFAIKKGSFSTAMVRQYIVLAYNILQLKKLTAEQLANPNTFAALTGLSRKTDIVLERLREDSEKVLAEELGAV